jgi:homoserine dehydrogenase
VGKLLEHGYLRGSILKTVPIVLLGFGNVGQALAALLEERDGFAAWGLRLKLVAVCDSRGGALGESLSLGDVVKEKRRSGTVASLPRLGRSGVSAAEALASAPDAVLVDASPTNPQTGEPGLSAVRYALRHGHSTVLASKGPLVAAFGELVDLARANNCRIGLSAAVGSPLSSLDTMHLSLHGSMVRGFRGLLSEAANRILRELETGKNRKDAVAGARRAGVLEPDPSLDLDGWDTAFKVLILARSIWDPAIPLDRACVQGITEVSEETLARARDEGKKLRLIGSARSGPRGWVEILVGPEALDPEDPLFPLGPGEKGAVIDSDLMGRFVIRSGKGGPLTTAASIAKDILNIAAHPTPFAL